jgi:hypothetical protein
VYDVVALVSHRAELQHLERLTRSTHARLAEEHRSRTRHPDEESGDQQDRNEQHEQQRGERDVE